MYRLTITVGGVETDYTRFLVYDSLQITEKLNVPTQMTFRLAPIGQFTLPVPRGYVKLYSTTTVRSLYTGFIVAEPVREFLSLASTTAQDHGGQLFEYLVTCISDEYLLNIKSVPFIPAYVNRTQGEILANLAEVLAPGFFDTSEIDDGDLVAYFQYDPSQSWSEVAKKFGDGSRYRYKVRDRIVHFKPYGDLPLGISYDENKRPATFNAKALKTNVFTVPIVNDVTMIGDVEAGNNREDYVIGDGFTGNFPLRHKVFRGESVILVQETWNGLAVDAQQWTLLDPNINFDFSNGAMNIVTPSDPLFDLGSSYLALNNGLELGGGLNLEHGEYTFIDYCNGVIGGLYSDSTFGGASGSASGAGLLGGYIVTSPSGVVTGPGGAAGIELQPWWAGSGFVTQEVGSLLYVESVSGTAIGAPIITRLNHNYVLQTLIAAPKYVRYKRKYRTLDGIPYGGIETEVVGSVTFCIQDYDIYAASGFLYQPEVIRRTIQNVVLPAFAVYAVVNNRALNLVCTNTTIALMPLGTLSALMGPSGLTAPSGLILPMLPPGSGFHEGVSGYIGGVEPWPSLASGNILPPPLALREVSEQLVLGAGFQLQTAQITPGNSADTLGFYTTTLAAAGTRIRLQTWEAQAAAARLRDKISIDSEAFIVGDDGVRSAIIQDLNPLPRTSEDCDNAALAFLHDRTRAFYDGSYTATSLFFEGLTADLQFYPTVGRMFDVHAPRRNINFQKFMVTQLSIKMLDLATELVEYTFQFGPDLNLEKTLKLFIGDRPQGVLTSKDKANPPNPRFTFDAATSYLPDLEHVEVDPVGITETGITVNVRDYYRGPVEVRRQDSNWGRGDTPDLLAIVAPPQFTLPRTQFDQQWYLRPVQALSGEGMVNIDGYDVTYVSGEVFKSWRSGVPVQLTLPGETEATQYLIASVADTEHMRLQTPADVGVSGANYLVDLASVTSRRSKVLRVSYPLRPNPPKLRSSSAGVLQFDYGGDVRSVYGFELRTPPVEGATGNAAGQVVLYQRPVVSIADMAVDVYGATPFGTLPAASGEAFEFWAYFFNHMWGYSEPLRVIDFGGELSRAPFEVVREGYAMLTIKNLNIENNLNVDMIRELNFLVPSLDDTDVRWGGHGELDADSDPVTISYTPFGTLPGQNRFGTTISKGDYIVWNCPPGSGTYEIDKVLEVDYPASFQITLERRPSGALLGQAQFGSTKGAQVGFFHRVEPRVFSEAIRKDTVGTPFPTTESGLPEKWEWAWANKTVLAVISQVVTDLGRSPTYTLNLAATGTAQSPPCPGYRTLNGAAYTTLDAAGDIYVGMTARRRARVQAWESIRAIYGYMTAAASGTATGPSDDTSKGTIVAVVAIDPGNSGNPPPDGQTAYLLDMLQFRTGDVNSYPPDDQPDGRQMPYHVRSAVATRGWTDRFIEGVVVPDFPPSILPVLLDAFNGDGGLKPDFTIGPNTPGIFKPDWYLDFIVLQEADDWPGTDLTIVVQT